LTFIKGNRDCWGLCTHSNCSRRLDNMIAVTADPSV